MEMASLSDFPTHTGSHRKQVVRKTKIKCGEIYIHNLVVIPLTSKCSSGDHIRIIEKKRTFDEGYTQIWTEEVFVISKIQLPIPVTYKITDYNGVNNSRFVLRTRS